MFYKVEDFVWFYKGKDFEVRFVDFLGFVWLSKEKILIRTGQKLKFASFSGIRNAKFPLFRLIFVVFRSEIKEICILDSGKRCKFRISPSPDFSV
jgi:hypothetical protein